MTDAARLTVLILGGYGVFGGRLARLLADEPRLVLLIGGRSREKAEAFCHSQAGAGGKTLEDGSRGAELRPVVVDRDHGLADVLARLKPDVVVDATGPFQSYGPAPYGVVEACIAGGITYLDLADGSEFVAGLTAFDEAARARGIAVLGGASSFPVLTVAAVEELSRGMVRIENVRGGIAPSPFAGVGGNVVRAIAGYAGQPVQLRRNGRQETAHALTEGMTYTVSPPGRVPLRATYFSLVDVPDLRVLPERWPELRNVWMGAGPVPEILHRALNALSWLVRWHLLPSLLWLAPLMERAINTLRWGEHRGGMFVEVTGYRLDGHRIDRSWHLLAEGDDGPLIPSMAIEGMVRKMLSGETPRPGARAASGELTLADYDRLFARRRITTGRREGNPEMASRPLYRVLLGEAWERLPVPIRAMHDGTVRASGRAEIERGHGLAARLLGAIFGFPPEGRDVPVTVTFSPVDGGEDWRRDFGGRAFHSIQTRGSGRREWLLLERFGPVTVALALVFAEGRLSLVPHRSWLLGIPLPRFMMPGGHGHETVEEGRFRFDVEIAHPWTGPIVRYRGWLVPEESRP